MAPTRTAVREWITDYLVRELQLRPEAITPDKTFEDYGLDSFEQAVLAGMMEDAFSIDFEIGRAFATPTIRGVVDALVAAGLAEDA